MAGPTGESRGGSIHPPGLFSRRGAPDDPEAHARVGLAGPVAAPGPDRRIKPPSFMDNGGPTP